MIYPLFQGARKTAYFTNKAFRSYLEKQGRREKPCYLLLCSKSGRVRKKSGSPAGYSGEGIHAVAEYWLQTSDPNVIAIFETDSITQIMQAETAWDDVFDISVFPAITAEEGMELAKKMMG